MALRPIEELAAQYARERDAALKHEPARRRRHGIVHTPPELAQLVLRVSDWLLCERLFLQQGVCDPSLALIDPACGPGAFFAAALALAEARGGPPLHGVGFDVDASALAWARRLSGHACGSQLTFSRADVLASNAVSARAAGHEGPLLVLGNPPWATARSQLAAADRARLALFQRDAAGAALAERKSGVLTDVYVRFFALAAELARARTTGVLVALVSNASYLDGIVHRGMRAQLLASFDEVYVLDLGGSALLGRRREPRDDNVFGVRPGVAVTWLCRYPVSGARGPRRKLYARLYGTQRQKLARLAAATPDDLGFRAHEPEPPLLCFVPRRRTDARYASYPSLAEWLPFHREGVQSNRDAAVVELDSARLLERLNAFSRGQRRPDLISASTALSHYDPKRARRAVAEALERDPSGERGLVVQRLAYRPFDERVFCPVTPLCHRPRAELARAFAHAPAALVSVRKDRGDLPWTHSAWSDCTVDNCYLSARSSCRARAFPLRTPTGEVNLAPTLLEALAARVGTPVGSEELAHYALCIVSARCYRSRWDAELHHDYPRIPLPADAAALRVLSGWGALIARLHASPCEATVGAVPEPPERCRHRDLVLSERDGRVCLGSESLFAVDPAALQLHVGHHRPLAAYLRARAELPLDRAALGGVYAIAQRLSALERALREADAATASVLGYDAS